MYARAQKRLNLYKLVRRPPCWNSTARLARHARLDLLDKVERVESSRAKWNLGYMVFSLRCSLLQYEGVNLVDIRTVSRILDLDFIV